MFFMRALYLLGKRLGAWNPGIPDDFAALQHAPARMLPAQAFYSKE
jgi:hypothetical protein